MTIQPGPTITIDGEAVTLRPMTDMTQMFLAKLCKDSEDANAAFVMGYALAASRPGIEAVAMAKAGTFFDECSALALELSEQDTQSVIDYLTAYFERKAEASFTVPDTGKKPTAATRRRTNSR